METFTLAKIETKVIKSFTNMMNELLNKSVINGKVLMRGAKVMEVTF